MNIEQLLTEFKTYKVDVEGKEPKSIDQYIRYFNEFCKDSNINDYNTLIHLQSQTIRDWLSILANRGNGTSTRNNKLTAVKQVFLYLEDEKLLDIDRTIQKIKFAKTPKKETKYPTADTMEELLYIITNQRVKSAVAIIECTGVRFKELMQITCTDILRGFATVIGKGNKERTIYFPDWCIKICQKFINDKRQHIVERTGVKTDLLLISDEGTPLTRQSFSTSLKHYTGKTGLYWSNEMSPHKIRHGYITKELDEGTPTHVVRDIAGHANLATTDRYSHADKQRIKDAMLKDNKEE